VPVSHLQYIQLRYKVNDTNICYQSIIFKDKL
jgi:hypothetical protein